LVPQANLNCDEDVDHDSPEHFSGTNISDTNLGGGDGTGIKLKKKNYKRIERCKD